MRRAELDWVFLRRALIWLAISVVVSGALVSASYMFSHKAAQAFQREHQHFSSVRSQFLRLDEDKETMQVYYPRYEELIEAGIIGTEHRLDWIESLRAAAARAKLLSLRYELAAQRSAEPSFPVETGAFKVYASEMTVELGLLHEGDFPRFFTELDRLAGGLYTVSGCSFKRAGVAFSTDPATRNVTAECKLSWYTVKLPKGEGAS